jgi:ATP-dependent helicase/nuclease subunit A
VRQAAAPSCRARRCRTGPRARSARAAPAAAAGAVGAGEEHGADPPLPPGAGGGGAARRADPPLLERLPESAGAREDAARALAARNAADSPTRTREICARARGARDRDWAELFSPGALAEVPIAATVGGQVIAGTIDRLLVEPDRVLVRLQDRAAARRRSPRCRSRPAPDGRLCRRARAIYPGRGSRRRCSTPQTPLLIAMPAEVLERTQAGLMARE